MTQPEPSACPPVNKDPVIVIGAGIVGVATAIWLQRAGRETILIDRGEPGSGASFGNGGVLACCSIVPVNVPGLLGKAPRMLLDPDQPLFLKWSYLPRLAPWLRQYLGNCRPETVRRVARALHGLTADSPAEHQTLAAGTGAEAFIHPGEYLYAYPSRRAYEADRFGWDLRREYGFHWQEVEDGELRRIEPLLCRDLGFAVRLYDHGRIADPGAYVGALAAHFIRSGGRFLRSEVTDIVHKGGHVRGVRIGGETIACSAVVIATGAWSGALLRRLGLSVPLESERGYHVELIEPNRMPERPIMFTAGKFVATPMDGRIRLAGIVEFGGLEAPASRAPVDLLLRSIRRAMPDLRWRDTAHWMGHRPATADSIPVIGPLPGIAGVYAGFGHHHVGLTAGPRTGRLLAQLVCGQTPNISLAPYAPSRFE